MRKLRSRVNQLRLKLTSLESSKPLENSAVMKSLSNWHLYSYNDYETNRHVRSPWADYFTDIFSRTTRLLVNDVAFQVTSVAVPRLYFNSYALTGSLFAQVTQKYSGEVRELVEPVYVRNKFDPIEMQVLTNDNDQSITTIVPISGRTQTLLKFLDKWMKLSLLDNNLYLIVSVMDTNLEEIKKVETVLSDYKTEKLSIVKQIAPFSRGPALQVALKEANRDGLYFYCDVGTDLNHKP